MNWNNIKDKTPKSGETVLAYWWEEDIHQVHMLTWYEKGDKFTGEDLQRGMIDMLELVHGVYDRKVEETGFYFLEINKEMETLFTPHADIITHWMSIPAPPNSKKGWLGGIEQE
ncbi:MAG: hypothetical protein WC292_00245 [Clostridia bacterium]